MAYMVDSVFTNDELSELRSVIDNLDGLKEDAALGRISAHIQIPLGIYSKVLGIANSKSDVKLKLLGTSYVKYSNQYGKPSLPPHFDGGICDLIIDFQLKSNTSWNLGVDLENYSISDNSALIFNPNLRIHWRPHKKFQDGEYVEMLFFRFINANQTSDYSHMIYSQDHQIFKEANKIRDNLS